MKRIIQKTLAVAVLAAGLAMLVLGGRGFASKEQPMAISGTDEQGGSAIRMCPPTAGEIAEEFGVGLAARKLACSAVAGAGLFIAGSALLSLLPRKEQA